MRTPLTRIVAGLIACVLGIAACMTTGPASPSPAPTSSLVAPLPGQTETEWGLIWDTLPEDFPTYPDAVPSEESATGPASANLVVDGVDPATVITWTDPALTNAGFTVTEGQESMEDGSMAIDAAWGTDCRVRVMAAPLGSLTSITILFGAGCPSP